MKKAFFLFSFSLFISLTIFSQDVIRQQSCNDTAIQKQADSIKNVFKEQGFVVLREASITMESEYEMPVVVQLQEGTLYHIVFIGDYTSKLYEVRMFDWDEKQVAYQKKQWGDVDGNTISFSYIPKITEFHMIKPVQVNKKKKKNLCGYIMLLQKVKK
jgi:hypothetical protein